MSGNRTTKEVIVAGSKMLVFSNAVAGRDEAFNQWYETQHLADVVQVPGVISGQRYELVPSALPGAAQGDTSHRYLAVYELDDDPEAVVAAFQDRAASGAISLDPSLDMASLSIAVWRPTGAAHTAGA